MSLYKSPVSKIRFVFIICFLLILSNSGMSQVQQHLLFQDEVTSAYFDYLLNQGQFKAKWVLQQPYRYGEIEMSGERDDFFKRYFSYFYTDRALSGQLKISERVQYHDDVVNRLRLDGSLYWTLPKFTFMNRTSVDQNYKYDPLFAGDLTESDSWIYGRVEEAYADYYSEYFSIRIGRTSNNWGPPEFPSLILSDNPYSYDHFLASVYYKSLKLSLIFARLEDLDAKTYVNPDSTVKNARKYFVGHRLDWRLSDRFQLGFTEMAIYGGPERVFEPAFLNPMNFYYALQRNDQIPISGIWALDMFYKPAQRWTVYTQFLLDDIIVNNDPGMDDRAQYPDRLGLMVSLRNAAGGFNNSVTYVRIWNRTYQSKETWENWHFRELGLGYPVAGAEEIRMKSDLWIAFPFYFSTEIIYGRYGAVSLTDLYPLEKETFPLKPVTENMVVRFKSRYLFSPSTRFGIEIEYFDKPGHYMNRINNGKGIHLRLNASYLLSGGITD